MQQTTSHETYDERLAREQAELNAQWLASPARLQTAKTQTRCRCGDEYCLGSH